MPRYAPSWLAAIGRTKPGLFGFMNRRRHSPDVFELRRLATRHFNDTVAHAIAVARIAGAPPFALAEILENHTALLRMCDVPTRRANRSARGGEPVVRERNGRA